MSVQYTTVGWNRQKKLYDAVLATGLLAYLALFIGGGAILNPSATIETLLIRALGTAAFLLLHIILAIGPLARLDRRFLPVLYNRRHLGVTMAVLALSHGAFSIVQFHALGDENPFLSIFLSNSRYSSISQFPFQTLGFLALLILLLMASTSHDFWLRNLTAPTWKRLHMLVYVAYALLVGHVTLGALQSERSPLLAALLITGATIVAGLHIVAGTRESRIDRQTDQSPPTRDGFVKVCPADQIPENRAVVRSLSGERIALFRYEGKVSALSAVCRHQNGPLGEGKIVDGCVTCPWHGYQYKPESGSSPAPFTETIPTFRTRVDRGIIYVHPQPLKPGTYTEPGSLAGQETLASESRRPQ